MLSEILSERHQMTIADMEAGLEHLSRSDGTLRYVDVLLVVLEPYAKSLETGRRTLRLARDLGIPKIYGVISKAAAPDEEQEVRDFAAGQGLEILAAIPHDDEVRKADRTGCAVVDTAPGCPAVAAVDELLDSIEEIFEAAPVGS